MPNRGTSVATGPTLRPDAALRVHHYDVNVRNLGESMAFLQACTSLSADSTHRNNDAGFLIGEHDGTVTGALLHNTAGPSTPTLHLLQWLDPPPIGVPHAIESAAGFYRIVVHSTDLEQTRRTVSALGSEPFAPTTGDDFRFRIGSRGDVPFHAFACHDPNGIVLEFVEGPVPRLSVVAQGTAELAGSSQLLRDALGLRVSDTVSTMGAMPSIYRPEGGRVRFHGEFLRADGDRTGYVDLLRFTEPIPAPAYVEPHRIGVMRAAFEVPDIEAAWRRVVALADRVTLEYPPTDFSFGGHVGSARIAGFRDAEGVRYQLFAADRANSAKTA